jgi:hypothetical protein
MTLLRTIEVILLYDNKYGVIPNQHIEGGVHRLRRAPAFKEKRWGGPRRLQVVVGRFAAVKARGGLSSNLIFPLKIVLAHAGLSDNILGKLD